MSDQIRAWRVIKSFGAALIIGIVAGLATTGLFSNGLIGDLDLRASLWVGLGVGVGLMLLFTYVFDQISLLVGRAGRAAERSKEKLSVGKERLGQRLRSRLKRRR